MDPVTATSAVAAAAPLIAGLDGQGLTTSAVAGVVLSHVLQPYMAKVPAFAKPLIPVLTGVGGAVVACMGQGMGFREALHYGLVTTVASMVNHRLAFAKPAAA